MKYEELLGIHGKKPRMHSTWDDANNEVLIPFGISGRHTWHEYGVIFEIIRRYEIDFFVELGTWEGALAGMLEIRRSILDGFGYISIDNDPSIINSVIKKLCGIRLMEMNVFSQQCVRMLTENMLQETLPVMIYCDNGRKAEEIKLYAPLCRPGDVIACHDFWDGKRVVRDVDMGSKPGLQPEVTPEDLEFLKDGFTPLPEELLGKTRIAAFIKD